MHLIKGPKSKFPGGVHPWIPLVSHMLCTQIYACPPPPNNPYNLILPPPPPLGKKLKENLTKSVCVCAVFYLVSINQIHHPDLVYYTTRIALET